MTKQVIWTEKVIETFIKEGNLNERREFLIRSRAKGMSIVEQALALNLSVDQVNKEIAALKKIYDAVQKHSDILPKREKCKKDL